LLKDFAIRKGSGGTGHHHGGDGVIREIQFREDMAVSILSTHRKVAPFGLSGGNDALCGENLLRKQSGEILQLNGSDQVDISSGDSIIIKTPGGGGFGHPD
jgi:5-oxoprolinase (ATP-hydrolysing)